MSQREKPDYRTAFFMDILKLSEGISRQKISVRMIMNQEDEEMSVLNRYMNRRTILREEKAENKACAKEYEKGYALYREEYLKQEVASLERRVLSEIDAGNWGGFFRDKIVVEVLDSGPYGYNESRAKEAFPIPREPKRGRIGQILADMKQRREHRQDNCVTHLKALHPDWKITRGTYECRTSKTPTTRIVVHKAK